MRIKLSLILVSLLIGVLDPELSQSDIIDSFAKYFRGSNASKMADNFSSTLQLSILSEENDYSKAQAEQIMRDFFSKNKPVSVTIVHRLNSNPNYKLAVFSMQTPKDKLRISISFSTNGTKFLVKEMRVEHDKE